MKKVAIVQSNYIPWKGYFDMIAAVDEFMLYDDMQYTHRDWRNRNRIKTPQGLQWLTVPVTVKGKYHQKIRDTEIDGSDWASAHWKTLIQNYRKAAHFTDIGAWLEGLYIQAYMVGRRRVSGIFSALEPIRSQGYRSRFAIQRRDRCATVQEARTLMRLSVVATLYQSAAYVAEFHRRATMAARQLVGDDYEIVLVNDGSPDNSLDIAVQMTEGDSHLVVVDLSRNFGHHRAMLAGLEHARGERVFLIDSDLEEEPEWLPTFAERLEQEACDIVFGVQQRRKGGWFERWSGWVFYQLFDVLIGFDFPRNMVTARLMTRRYVDALLRHSEREISIGGLFLITGFDQIAHPVKKHDKEQSTYNFRRKMVVVVNSITSFSNKPLEGIFYIGMIIFVIASIYTFYIVANWLFLGTPLVGWTSVMASIWLLGGLVISLIGIIGIYLSKIFIETKQRPNYIVRQIYGGSENQ